ncbi:unnamed protein product [Brachionus calyciflorus]|uniref:Snake toxin/toxin-like domain-containing protein n=1 Tax=Brachionus calyciflorus TaxID=104777 RepID=A0A813M308_9BILA|nr:unnamed protein product [Brachionus calyciflorus]
MKIIIFCSILFVAYFTKSVYSIQCVTCQVCPGSSTFNSSLHAVNLTTCSGSCLTSTVNSKNQTTITKSCSSNCTASNSTLLGFQIKSECCNTDRCNKGDLNAIECYTCDVCPGSTGYNSTVNPVKMSSCFGSCLTTRGVSDGKTLIRKECSSSCQPIKTNLLGIDLTNECCNSDRCNSTPKLISNFIFIFITVFLILFKFFE